MSQTNEASRQNTSICLATGFNVSLQRKSARYLGHNKCVPCIQTICSTNLKTQRAK